MKTQQPVWRCVAQLGDADPVEYGGFWVFVDDTGVYPPEAEKLEGYIDDQGVERFTAYRFILEDCTYIDGILSDNKFHPDLPVWFADKLPQVSSFCDVTVSALIGMFCSKRAETRAMAWRTIGEYFGFHELDDYPLEMNRAEAEERYAQDRFKVQA